MACIKQRPFRLPSGPCKAYRSFEDTDDYTWAHRAVVHCADVLNFCYGRGTKNSDDYEELSKCNRRWRERRPDTFTPLYHNHADSRKQEFFPELWFLSDCHVTGVQHMDLASIMLTVYNPLTPKLGPGSRIAACVMDDEIKTTVRRLCGVALSNRRAPPAMNTACIAIAMCKGPLSIPEAWKPIESI